MPFGNNSIAMYKIALALLVQLPYLLLMQLFPNRTQIHVITHTYCRVRRLLYNCVVYMYREMISFIPHFTGSKLQDYNNYYNVVDIIQKLVCMLVIVIIYLANKYTTV